MNPLTRLSLTLAFSAFALSAAADAAGINTSRSNAKNSGATATDRPQPVTRAIDSHLEFDDVKPSKSGRRGQGSNRGYVVGSQGVNRMTDITVNEEGIESPRADVQGLATGKRTTVATGDVTGDWPEAPQAGGGWGRPSGRR